MAVSTQTWAVLAGAAVGGVILGTAAFMFMGGDSGYAHCTGGQIAGGDIGGPFTLIDETGTTVTEQDVITAPTLVYFGYTFCPDICPMDVQRNGFALEELDDRGREVNALFITIDPARDTVDVVRDYTANFHERMIGLTGSDEQIAAAVRAYRAYAAKDTSGDPEYYLMNHSTFTYLVTPQSGFVDFFARELTPETVADRVECFMDAGA